MRDQIDLLIDGADAQSFSLFGRAWMYLDTFEANRPAIAWEDPGKHFYQRAFARPVLAHQCMDVAATNGEVHALQCLYARKGFGKLANFQQGWPFARARLDLAARGGHGLPATLNTYDW